VASHRPDQLFAGFAQGRLEHAVRGVGAIDGPAKTATSLIGVIFPECRERRFQPAPNVFSERK
jgi:hypothetical protein